MIVEVHKGHVVVTLLCCRYQSHNFTVPTRGIIIIIIMPPPIYHNIIWHGTCNILLNYNPQSVTMDTYVHCGQLQSRQAWRA